VCAALIFFTSMNFTFMKNKIILFAGTSTAIGLTILTLAGNDLQQPSGIKRTELQRHDLPITGREVVQVLVEFDPGAAFGKHKHPGEEVIYVTEGVLEYEVEGQMPVTLKAGEVLFIRAGTIHAAKNRSKSKSSELATYIVEKDKPPVVLVK
jgi:quercetin dioxygenase-like cupin family protein